MWRYGNDTDPGLQGVHRKFSIITTADMNIPFFGLVEPAQQIDSGGLSASVEPTRAMFSPLFTCKLKSSKTGVFSSS
jgi:hypothetical protein